MNDAVVAHECQRLQHLTREAADKTGCEAMEVVRLDQFVQIDAQQLHRNTQVATEVEVLSHLDNMVLLIRILSCHEQHRSRHTNRRNVPISADCQGS